MLKEAEKAELAGDWDAYDAKVQEYEATDASFADPQNRLDGQNVMPVYLAMKNPLRVDAAGENASGFDIAAAVKQAIRKNHDGLIIENLDDAAGLYDRPATHHVVFNPGQIKSAIGNNGRSVRTTRASSTTLRRQRPTWGISPEQRAENFARFTDNAPLISSQEADSHDFKTGQKIVVEAYHGSARPDRIGSVFDPKRATSGPMAFFTSSPDLASNYAKGKEDTSLAYEDVQYANWFFLARAP